MTQFDAWWNATGCHQWQTSARADLRAVFEAGREAGFDDGKRDNPLHTPFEPEAGLRATYKAAPALLVALKWAMDKLPDDGSSAYAGAIETIFAAEGRFGYDR